jgi:hypothetical protein
MPDVYTPNKNLIEPAQGSYDNSWGTILNSQNWTGIDNSFGGLTTINVTGVAAGTIALTVNQYQPPNIVFTGTLNANLVYVIPAGVGGMWTIYNNTSPVPETNTLFFGISGGGSEQLAPTFRSLLVSDGVNLQFAETAVAANALANAQIYASNAANNALASANAYTNTYASDASNLATGTAPASVLPLAGSLEGITIAPDPGTVPTGPAGSIWYYY